MPASNDQNNQIYFENEAANNSVGIMNLRDNRRSNLDHGVVMTEEKHMDTTKALDAIEEEPFLMFESMPPPSPSQM